MKLIGSVIGAFMLAIIVSPAPAQSIDSQTMKRIDRILRKTPLIDGHNDLAEQLRENYQLSVDGLASGTDKREPPLMTDMARLHQGRVGAQFWSVYIPSEVTGDNAIRETMEQIDTVQRFVNAYPNDLALARTADDIVRIHKSGKVASLIGIEGGHQIGGSMAALRQFYDLGARYMTLSHFKNNEFADSATDDPKWNGLNDFGKAVVHEMNRLGMLVDLSHVSPDTMRAAIAVSKAPVIFSHSDARALVDHPRNVPDDVLRMVAKNGGVVMVNFFMGHLSEPYRHWSADHAAEDARLASLYTGQPEIREAKLKEWEQSHPAPTADVGIIADHIEHVVQIAGHDHVGIGGDLDGIGIEEAPRGMNSVNGYPFLFAELIRRGWSDSELAKLAGGNLLRVMRQVEDVSRSMKDEPPSLARLNPFPVDQPWK